MKTFLLSFVLFFNFSVSEAQKKSLVQKKGPTKVIKKNLVEPPKDQVNQGEGEEQAVPASTPTADLETSSEPVATPKVAPGKAMREDVDARWHFTIGLGYSLYSKLTFSEAKLGSTTYKLDLDYEQAPTFNLEARRMPKRSFGVIFGLQYDLDRKITGATLTGGGTTISSTSVSNPSKLQLTNTFGNAVYRWGFFYIPLGLNYSFIKFTPSSGSTLATEFIGGLGAQLGVGFYISKKFSLENSFRVISLKVKEASTNDYGTGYFMNFIVMAKYSF